MVFVHDSNDDRNKEDAKIMYIDVHYSFANDIHLSVLAICIPIQDDQYLEQTSRILCDNDIRIPII